jgi:dipeptidyl aminopeptidase/acylaminoacyl peptidase
LNEAVLLTTKGYSAMLFDLRNHGWSDGNLSTLGYYEAEDVQGAVTYLRSRPEVNPERIGLIGHSMGGVAVLRAAVHLPRVKVVVAESAFASSEDNIAQGMIARTGLPPFLFAPSMVWLGERIRDLRITQICPIDDVALIAPRPVLLVHGEPDTTVRVSNSAKLSSTEPQEFSRRVSGFGDWGVRSIERA